MTIVIGSKVVPIKKTSGSRDVTTCASYYRRIEKNQAFLYVNAIDEEGSQKAGEPCYWCDADGGMGDSYRASDLIPYQHPDLVQIH